MSKVEIISTITYRSLMNKSKSDLADMVLQYADINGQLHEALQHAKNCGVCKADLLCWEGHRLYVAAGVSECRNPDYCYVHSRHR